MLQLVVASLLAANAGFESKAPALVAQAGAVPQTPEEKKKLQEEIARELGATPAPQAAPTAPPAPGATGQTGGNPLARLLLLPDISAIGSFALAYDTYDAATLSPRSGPASDAHKVTPRFEELELALQSVVDPYARADIFISFTPEGVDVEEAYLTTLSLPAGIQLRAGKFKSPFGRINQQHPHTFDFVDAPLALNRLVAAESLSGPGAEVSWLAPVPWFLELRLAGQATVAAGALDPTGAADGSERRTLVARALQFFDVGETSALGAGLSVAHVEGRQDDPARDLGAVDVYLKLRPPSTRSYVAIQGELFGRRLAGTSLEDGSLGGYVQATWRNGPYWAYGVRYDNAPSADPNVESGAEHRWSAIATWLPSEFQRIRLQVAYDRRPGGAEGLEALLHLEFIIGSHGAHPF